MKSFDNIDKEREVVRLLRAYREQTKNVELVCQKMDEWQAAFKTDPSHANLMNLRKTMAVYQEYKITLSDLDHAILGMEENQ